MDHRQKDWQEQLALVEFIVNNKVHLATKISLFIANNGKELRIGADIGKKGKVENIMEFAERMKKVQKEAGAALIKAQEKIKKQADRGKKEVEERRQDGIKYKELDV